MLLTLLLWIYTTVLTFWAGHALLRIGHRLMGFLPVLATPFICLLGAASLTAILGWTWLWVPINLTTHLVVAGLLTGYAIWKRPKSDWNFPRWRDPWLGWLTIGVLFMVVWLRSVQLPRLVDTGGYHAPMIEWIHQYAIVPGLANLNYRFGFNNSWFLFSTLFRFQLAPGVLWHGLNGWLLAMMGWFSLTEWHRWQTAGLHRFTAWLGGWLALSLLLIFHWTLSSPSPDLPTHVYVTLCFWVWLRRSETDQQSFTGSWAWLLLILSLSALTTKLSAVTVLLLPMLVVLQVLTRRNWTQLLVLGTTALFFTGYWWVGNVVLSGYITYPSLSPLLDWFSVDWKVPRTLIAIGLSNLQQGTRGDLGATFSLTWVPYWFETRPVLEQSIFVALLLAPVVIVWSGKSAQKRFSGYVAARFTAWSGVVFWFFLAPEIRFGAGTILMALGLSYGPLLYQSEGWQGRTQLVTTVVTGLIGFALLLAAIRREPVNWLLPAGYPVSHLQTYRTNTHSILYPTDDRRVINGIRGYWGNCYDTALPCSPYPIPGLEGRGKTLRDGFRTVQSNRH